MERSPNGLIILGVLIALLGTAGLAMPEFTTQKTTDVAKIGGLQLQAQEDTPHIIPPLLSGGALFLGIVLVAGGLYRKR